MKAFKNKFNTKPTITKASKQPSLTVQGEAYTVTQLFERAAQQGAFPIETGTAQYIDVENIDQITDMYKIGLDLVDIEDHKQHVKKLEEAIQLSHLQSISKQASSETSSKKEPQKPQKDENAVKGKKEANKGDTKEEV